MSEPSAMKLILQIEIQRLNAAIGKKRRQLEQTHRIVKASVIEERQSRLATLEAILIVKRNELEVLKQKED